MKYIETSLKYVYSGIRSIMGIYKNHCKVDVYQVIFNVKLIKSETINIMTFLTINRMIFKTVESSKVYMPVIQYHTIYEKCF